ncbi:MAG: hypothetical protein WCJ95_08650 [Mariniphaga sp.]
MVNDPISQEILNNLKSTDTDFVLETIEKIRESGNRLIMEGIVDLLHNTQIPEIKKSILNLLSELKNKESIPLLLEAIKNEKYLAERKELVACCSQNGLNYNEYLPVFIDLVINHSFLIAFEAFTVIENMYGVISDEVIDQEIAKINNALQQADEEKAYLLRGLVTIIHDIPEKSEFSE